MRYFVPVTIIAREKAAYISDDLTGNYCAGGIWQEQKVHKC